MKLRQTGLSETSIAPIISMFPSLRRLDVSFTSIVHANQVSQPYPPLEKLSVTSTAISMRDLVEIITNLPTLHTLALGALGTQPGAISNSTAMTLNDATLRSLTDALQDAYNLEKVNLIGNTKLGSISKESSALLDFIRRVGRRCKVYSRSSFTSAYSHYLRSVAQFIGNTVYEVI